MCNEGNGASTFNEGYGSIYKADRSMEKLGIFDLNKYIPHIHFLHSQPAPLDQQFTTLSQSLPTPLPFE
jgi:hypothetical protein